MPKFQHRLCQRRTRHLQMPQSSKCISLRSFKPKIIEYYMVPPAYLMLALASALTLSFGYAMPHFDLRHQWMQPQVGETAMLRDARATVWRRKLDIFQTIITSLYTRQSILTEYSTSKTKKHETLPLSFREEAVRGRLLSSATTSRMHQNANDFWGLPSMEDVSPPLVSDYSRQVHDKYKTHTHTAHT